MIEVPISLLLITLMVLVLLLAFNNYYFNSMLNRNEEVFNFRTSILDSNYDNYIKLPDYNTMLAYYMVPLDYNSINDWINFDYPRTDSSIMAAYYYYIKYKGIRADRKALKP